tara:strand:- start:63 stop:392 length:330 start_codon:yes stop_codon:yes gene_type:complete
MTVSQLLPLIPVTLHDRFAQIFSTIDGDQRFLQVIGDLEDIEVAIKLDLASFEKETYQSQIARIIKTFDFLMACSSVMGFEDARQIGHNVDFVFDYPDLYRTLEIYVWA